MITTAIVLGILAAILDWFIGGIKEPWRMVILIGVVVLLIVGIVMLLVPGLVPLRLGVY